jgi:hypothetical protein
MYPQTGNQTLIVVPFGNFQIARHKTGQVAPATLVLGPLLWKQLYTFLTVRRQLKGFTGRLDGDNAPVFLTWPVRSSEPMEMTNSNVDKALKSIWRKAKITKTISGTHLRKATVTSVDILTRKQYIQNKLIY